MGIGAKKARLTQPVEALSSFQSRQIDAVDFSQLDPIELSTYHRYMIGREIVRQEAVVRRANGQKHDYVVQGLLRTPASHKVPMEFKPMTRTRMLQKGLAFAVKMLRETYHLGKEFVGRIPGNPGWFLDPATRVLVLWPEWPCKSYFAIPLGERLRRVKAFLELSEADLRAQRAYLLNPDNPSTAKIAIVRIAILAKRSAHQRQQQESYEAIQQIHAPELFTRSQANSSLTKKQGGGSEKRQIVNDLNSYAAHMLCVTGKIPSAQARQYLKHPSGHPFAGKPVYQSTKQLLGAAHRFPAILQKFRTELEALPVHIGPPLNRLEMSLPDWAQLETAINAHPEDWHGSRTDLEAIEQTNLDENTRKVLTDQLLNDIALLDRTLQRIGSTEDRVTLETVAGTLQGILHRLPRADRTSQEL
jgi:hypothetical protein